jgi:flagellin-like hook-associated protein FlgL
MRAQITGLDQARRDVQDGVSLVQTAEGALSEVHSMLDRLRELSVHYDIGTIDITAAGAPTDIDAAITAVSTSRSAFGALQNRLEHLLNNLATHQENLVASESRIRDVDMAAEMVNFTTLQIRQQAGTSMLAQANQAPQSVLSLLR